MSEKNKISRLYSKSVKLNSAVNQSRAENKNKQELINKLTEQNKMLREALARLTCCGVAFNNADELDDYEDVATVQSNFNDELINAKSILEQTK